MRSASPPSPHECSSLWTRLGAETSSLLRRGTLPFHSQTHKRTERQGLRDTVCTVCVGGWTEVDKLNRWGRRRGGGIISLYLPALWPARRASHSPHHKRLITATPPPLLTFPFTPSHPAKWKRGLKSESILIFSGSKAVRVLPAKTFKTVQEKIYKPVSLSVLKHVLFTGHFENFILCWGESDYKIQCRRHFDMLTDSVCCCSHLVWEKNETVPLINSEWVGHRVRTWQNKFKILPSSVFKPRQPWRQR